MTTEPSYTLTCQWCLRDVVNPVRQPSMVEVTWRPDDDHHLPTVARICGNCLVEWQRFIGGRPSVARPVRRRRR